MPQVVRLYRDAAETHGRDLFACSPTEWQFLLELGRTFGWQPHGATYQLPSNSKLAAAARRDYEPGAAADRKLVDAEDAISWARALEEAQKSPHFAAMLEARMASLSNSEGTAQSIADSLDEFIQYAFGGAFTFARDEGSSGPTKADL
jgi:hypothetical protein